MRGPLKQLSRQSAVKALETRKKAGCRLLDPICVYDVAERLGVEIRFFDTPSMEGMYRGSPSPTIVVSSLRPPGRQIYTAAHELGHHVFGHGAQFDELVEDRSEERRFDPLEYQADCFAGELLMPKVAVSRGFALRKLDPSTCSPEDFYTVATWLGVGYGTLIHHMLRVMRSITESRAEILRRQQPIAIRAAILGRECRENLIIANEHWSDRAVDLQVGDYVLLPDALSLEGQCAQVLESHPRGTLVRAERPGLGRAAVETTGWSVFLRVSRKSYVGRGIFRFEEEVDE